jgi:RNA polymerase sigma-70 factor (ECF subfamily)
MYQTLSPTPDDSHLLKRVGEKDTTAMELFYKRYETMVYRFAFKKLNNEFEAAEIVNTVMLEVWNRPTFEGRSKVSTWLMSITHHRVIDLLRKRKAEHVDIDSIPHAEELRVEHDVQKIVSSEQTLDLIGECLQKLSGDQKQVLELLFFQESTYNEIAKSMNSSVGTVKSRVHHAKKLLKLCLSKRLD